MGSFLKNAWKELAGVLTYDKDKYNSYAEYIDSAVNRTSVPEQRKKIVPEKMRRKDTDNSSRASVVNNYFNNCFNKTEYVDKQIRLADNDLGQIKKRPESW
jgi:hypothetical protein